MFKILPMKKKNIFIILFVFFLGLVFQKNYVSDFPNFTHAWAQADHYALALGFVENDLNFFKPETKVLNHQFPDNWMDQSKSSRTAVDFPIHDFIPAVIMKLSGNNSPIIFRLYILLYSFLGLFFVFKLTQLLTSDIYKSIIVVLFAATSPVFIYYQNGFLPTIPSLANAIIGIYFYVRYLKTIDNKYFVWSLFFLTFATLSRTTFAIPLIAVVGFEFLRFIKHKVPLNKKVGPVIISFSCILIYQIYNSSLRSEYGSLFLSELMMPKNFNNVVDLFKLTIDNWLFQYFSKIHYLLILILILTASYFVAIRKLKFRVIEKQLMAFILIYFIGCGLFAFAMLRQFPAHDYYFLDSFYLPFILLVILLLTYIPLSNGKLSNAMKIAFIILLFIPLVQNGRQSQWDRRITGDWDRTAATIRNFEGAAYFLDSLQIPKNAKILALDVSAPNIPFILMNRKGYAQMKNRYHILKKMIDWDIDYVVYENEYFMSNSYLTYPAIINHITKIADNGKISLCRISKKVNKESLSEFLGIDKKNPVAKKIIDFEKDAQSNWTNINRSIETVFADKYAHKLDGNQQFGITFKTTDFPELKKSGTILSFEAMLNYSSDKNFEVVVSINENGETTYYKAIDLSNILKYDNQWQKVNLLFYLPKITSDKYEFGLYLMNNGKGDLFADDLKFEVYD